MRLHFLGTTGYHPNERRQTACLMLPEVGIILDAGTGLFRARDLIQTNSLSIFLTHAHLDHSIGITYLFDTLYGKDVPRVDVYAAESKIAALRDHLFHEAIFPAVPPIDFHALSSATPLHLPQGGRLTAIDLQHPGESLGFRLDWPGHSMAYITDTMADVNEPYVTQIADVDLLVHECYFPDGEEHRARVTGHSCLTPVVEVARRANVRRLALVHTNPLDVELKLLDIAAARKTFANLLVPNDRDVIEF